MNSKYFGRAEKGKHNRGSTIRRWEMGKIRIAEETAWETEMNF
jgi:hypothetical protein